jgi:hypothetical protein
MLDQTALPASTEIAQTKLLRVDDPADPLIDVIHRNLIAPNFPSDDRDSPEAIRTFLRWNRANRKRKIAYHVVAALRGGAPIGTTIFSFTGCERFCFMNGQYTSVVPPERRRRLAQLLSDYRVSLAQAEAIRFGYSALDFSVITLADPRTVCIREDERYAPSPAIVKRMWRGFGHAAIDFPFVQLPLADGNKALAEVELGIKIHSEAYRDREYLTSGEMKCILEACNCFRVSKGANSSYPQYRAMLDFLDRHPVTRILW